MGLGKLQITLPSMVVSAPRGQRGAGRSNFGVLGKGECVFYVDPEIAHRILGLTVTKKNLGGTRIAGRPIDDRRLGLPKRVCAVFASYQAKPANWPEHLATFQNEQDGLSSPA